MLYERCILVCEQVSTISRKAADGRTISTRVIQGPMRGKKRMMRVMRDTVNGAELVAEVEVPGDCGDVNAFLETLPSLGRRQRPGVTRRDSAGHYDNVLEDRARSSPDHVVHNGGTSITKVHTRTTAISDRFCAV